MRGVDAIDLRDWMVRIRMRNYARAGVKVTQADVEREVIADCQLVDNARASGDMSGKAKQTAPDLGARERVDVERIAADKGLRLDVSDEAPRYERFRIMHANPTTISDKWASAMGRVKRILETVAKNERGMATTSSLTDAVEGAELSQLAIECANLWSDAKRRVRKGEKPPIGSRNPFDGLSDRDFQRKLETMVYAICDRSTGKLGHWYTK